MDRNALDETQKFLNEPEICIWIDRYDDVFSDFDSRPFSARALSDDFLREVRKMVSEKTSDKVELKFHILDDQRNPESEAIIINNLNTHFRHIAEALKSEQNRNMQTGYVLLGAGFLLISFLFLSSLFTTAVYLKGLNLMLEPVGWFMTWTGLDHVFQISQKSKSALDFNSKMAFAEIGFTSFNGVQDEEADSGAPRQKTVIPFDNNNLRVAV